MSNISQPNIAVSTWGNIAPHWNRTTQYSNLLNLATTVPSSLPNQQYNNTINNKKRRQIILIHCGPKLGSSTLRKACEENMEQTCPQINFTAYINHAEVEEKGPAGYFGGDRMLSLMNECVDTHYFCVRDIEVMHMLPPSTTTTTTTTTSATIESDKATTAATMAQNVEYVHLFPFRNYNEWVESAIKQLYDRYGELECSLAMNRWDGGKCQHYRMEPDIRLYSRVDLDRFQHGVVRQINEFHEKSNNYSSSSDDNLLEEGEQEQHTFLLYLYKDLERVMELINTTYHIPMLPGTDTKLKGERPEGTCNESVVEQFHECFSDELMKYPWDLPENQVWRPGNAFESPLALADTLRPIM